MRLVFWFFWGGGGLAWPCSYVSSTSPLPGAAAAAAAAAEIEESVKHNAFLQVRYIAACSVTISVFCRRMYPW